MNLSIVVLFIWDGLVVGPYFKIGGWSPFLRAVLYRKGKIRWSLQEKLMKYRDNSFIRRWITN